MAWRFRVLSCLAVLVCGQLPAPGLAQVGMVWRCNSDGRVTYGDQPCEGGTALAVSDPRSAADVAEARLVAQRERALAQQMVLERWQRQHAGRDSGLAGVEPTPARVLRPPEPEVWQPPPPRRRRPAAAV